MKRSAAADVITSYVLSSFVALQEYNPLSERTGPLSVSMLSDNSSSIKGAVSVVNRLSFSWEIATPFFIHTISGRGNPVAEQFNLATPPAGVVVFSGSPSITGNSALCIHMVVKCRRQDGCHCLHLHL